MDDAATESFQPDGLLAPALKPRVCCYEMARVKAHMPCREIADGDAISGGGLDRSLS